MIEETVCPNSKCKNNKFYAWWDGSIERTVLHCTKCEYTGSLKKPVEETPEKE